MAKRKRLQKQRSGKLIDDYEAEVAKQKAAEKAELKKTAKLAAAPDLTKTSATDKHQLIASLQKLVESLSAENGELKLQLQNLERREHDIQVREDNLKKQAELLADRSAENESGSESDDKEADTPKAKSNKPDRPKPGNNS